MSARDLLIRKLKAEKKEFSRKKALKALSAGANPTEERFTKHTNKHVRARAERLANPPAATTNEDGATESEPTEETGDDE